VASAAALGQTAQSVDIAGDWILALERYGQTDCQRMKITVVDGRVKVDTGGFPVESELRNGRLDLRRAGDG